MANTFNLERALEQAAQPVNDYARGMTALTLQNIARQQQLQDAAAARDFAVQRDEAAANRRTKENREQERMQLATRYAQMGVETTDKDGNILPISKLNRNYQEFQKNRAENILTHFDAQLEANKKSQAETIQRIQATVTKQASPEQNRKALILTLADPVASKGLSDADKKQLESILLKGGDPDTAVRKVFDRLSSDYWFRKSKASATASAFYQKYLGEVNAGLDQSRQIDAVVYTKELDALNRESRDIALQRDRHILDFAPFLPKSAIVGSHETAEITPPADPNEAFASSLPNPTVASPAADIAKTPAPQPEAADLTPYAVPSSSEELGYNNFLGNQQASELIKKTFPGRTAPSQPAFDPIQAEARAMTNPQYDISALGGSKTNGLPTLQPGEAEKIKAVASLMGVPEQEFAAGSQRLQAVANGAPPQPGDDKLIQGLNVLLNMVRQTSMPLPTPGAMQ